MLWLHASPIVITYLNIWYTDMTLFKKDWLLMFPLGLFYIYANALGSYDNGHGLYPLIDWSDPQYGCPGTIFTFTVFGYLMAYMFYKFAEHVEVVWKRRP